MRRRTGQFLSDTPWQTIMICLVVGFIVFWQTGLMAWLKGLFTPSAGDKKVGKDDSFDSKYPSYGVYTPAKVRADAQALATEFKTSVDTSWWDTVWIVLSDSTAMNVIKNYTNPALKAELDVAYSTIATNGRDLNGDLQHYMKSDSLAYLRSKGIL